jgi:hypothetical protein
MELEFELELEPEAAGPDAMRKADAAVECSNRRAWRFEPSLHPSGDP